MSKIAIISDIHGNLLALEEVADDIQRRNVELIVNLGDHVSGPLWPMEAVDYLKHPGCKHRWQSTGDQPGQCWAAGLRWC